MPFVDAEHRKNPDYSIPGDRCYVWYRWMKTKWNAERRWSTVDSIYASVRFSDDELQGEQRAKELAWQVFFLLEVMPYELEKQELNGDIE